MSSTLLRVRGFHCTTYKNKHHYSLSLSEYLSLSLSSPFYSVSRVCRPAAAPVPASCLACVSVSSCLLCTGAHALLLLSFFLWFVRKWLYMYSMSHTYCTYVLCMYSNTVHISGMRECSIKTTKDRYHLNVETLLCNPAIAGVYLWR